ncbi:MAG TPA: type 1 glutamine amidotransferase domain-containing protein [Legionella sp.]|nr:type 1 glutamine amidotransferase domain-containing protein [Legionella sp.]
MTVVINLPEYGFDPTEATVPWSFLKHANMAVQFATPKGLVAKADDRMIKQGLGLLSPLLMTRKSVIDLYEEMIQSKEFLNPLPYEQIDTFAISAAVFPGGHGEGIKSMLESSILQKKIVECFKLNKVIGALCTGVLVVARSINPETGKSVLFDKNTTAITAWMEQLSWRITYPWYKNYFRIYPVSAQKEIEQLLQSPKQFHIGKWNYFPMQYTSHFYSQQFVVIDGNYISGRWPGDCYKFGCELVSMVKRQEEIQSRESL